MGDLVEINKDFNRKYNKFNHKTLWNVKKKKKIN